MDMDETDTEDGNSSRDDQENAFVAGFRAARSRGKYFQPMKPISERTARSIFDRYYEDEHE